MGRNERQAYLKAIRRLNRATTMTMNSTEIPPYRSVAKCQYIAVAVAQKHNRLLPRP